MAILPILGAAGLFGVAALINSSSGSGSGGSRISQEDKDEVRFTRLAEEASQRAIQTGDVTDRIRAQYFKGLADTKKLERSMKQAQTLAPTPSVQNPDDVLKELQQNLVDTYNPTNPTNLAYRQMALEDANRQEARGYRQQDFTAGNIMRLNQQKMNKDALSELYTGYVNNLASQRQSVNQSMATAANALGGGFYR